ncbi:MAG: hypothetical protein JRF33_02660 [Deltaproteobacteria bacterium]|nr:hypothetical protein [Deltaproteobacteria bacterium]
MRWVTLPALSIEVNELDVLQRYGGQKKLPAHLQGRVEAFIHDLKQSAKPKGKLAIIDIVKKRMNAIRLEEGTIVEGLGVAALLRRCEQVAAYVSTLGKGPDNLMRDYQERGRQAELDLFNVVAQLVLEDLHRKAEDFIRRLVAKEQRGISNALTPGMCDWPIEQQSILDALVGFESAGVHLLPSMVLIPTLTITGIVGIGPANSMGRNLAARPACAKCDKRPNCQEPFAN